MSIKQAGPFGSACIFKNSGSLNHDLFTMVDIHSALGRLSIQTHAIEGEAGGV